MKTQIGEPQDGTLTQSMDVGTKGFDEFQSIILTKSKSRTADQKRKVELLSLKYQMEDYLNSSQPAEKTVGYFLKLILKTLNVQQKQFAEYIGLKPSNLSKLISGERPINYDLALILGKLFSHNPMLWIEIQAYNELNRLQHAEDKYSNYSLTALINHHKNAI